MSNSAQTKTTLTPFFNEIGVTEQQFNELFRYAEKVIELNQITNLTGAKSSEEFMFKHILDSAMAFMSSASNTSIIYDIGSGCGVPGIVIAILNPETKVSLVEIRVKKSERLKEIVNFLGLDKRVSVINLGFEKLAQITKDADIWFKGFMPGDRLIEFLNRNFKDGLQNNIYLMKGPKWPDELSRALAIKKVKDIWKYRFRSAKNISYSLPNNEGQRILVKI